jgi:signal transduction histidine kinase
MARVKRIVSNFGEERIIAAVGGTYVGLAAVVVLFLSETSGQLAGTVTRFGLVSSLGLVLLYGGNRVRDDGLHPDVRPRIVAWLFGGLALMAVVVMTVEFTSGGLDAPLFSTLLATALGSVGGFGVGLHDVRAKSRQRELQETVQELRQSNERLEEFAYAASHDLQEPLRMVSSYLQLLENRHGDELDEEAEEFMDFALSGANRMQAMIGNLLEYSRVTTSGEPLEATDSEEVVGAVLDDLDVRIEETGATITVEELPTVNADPNQLSQLFQNLLSNALKYSGDEPPVVHVSAERTGDVWQFSVADEGIGIEEEYQDGIFDVFNQVHSGEDAAEEAGGIGLALCERIVERHGGDIWAESTPGEGTTFYFTIPAASGQ